MGSMLESFIGVLDNFFGLYFVIRKLMFRGIVVHPYHQSYGKTSLLLWLGGVNIGSG